MPKYNRPNQNGTTNGKQIVIIAMITIMAALMIIAIFVILSGRVTPDTATNDFLRNLERQRPGRESNPKTPGAAESAVSYVGVLTEIKPDALVITEKDTQNKITINLDTNTPITYNGQVFNRAKFYVGDQLEIVVKKQDSNWQAESIIVLVSASPATAAPLPVVPNVRPDGSIKPLGSD